MKKILLILSLCFSFMHFTMEAQRHRYSPDITPAGKGKVNTMIDNMGYWRRMVRLGYVRPNPNVKVPKAVFTGSKIILNGIEVQDSPDICLTGTNDLTQSENSVFINPENEDELLNSNNSSNWNGTNADTLYGADGLFSENAAANWTGDIEGTGNENSGDPSVAISLNGRWYSGKINGDFGQSVAWSDNQGTTWHDVVVSGVPSPGLDVLDKNHLWIDNSPSSPFQGNLYDGWTNFVTTSSDYHQVDISRSVDNGLTWSTPIGVSEGVHAGIFCHGVNLQTGPEGEVYCTFTIYDTWPGDESAIGFTKSINGGSVFTPATRIINNIKGIRTSGTTKNMRVNSFPSMTTDLSNGTHKGNIYIVWANNGIPGVNTGSDIDVYLIRSTDQGSTWSSPIRVNQDPSGLGKQHFLCWISCDPVTGTLCVIYYDDRNVSSTQCETWISYSYDAGDTWTDMKVSDVAFTPTPIPGLALNYFGDYLGVTSKDMMAYPVWTDNRDGNALTWVSPVNLGPPPGQPYIVYNSDTLRSIQNNDIRNLNFGDSLYMTLDLKNAGDRPSDSITAYLSSVSPYISITDSAEQYGDFTPGETKYVTNGYSFKVSDTIPNGIRVKFNVRASSKDSSWLSDFSLRAHAPEIKIPGAVLHDSVTGNTIGWLEPGESIEVIASVTNSGDFTCKGAWIKISSLSDFLNFTVDSVYLDSISPAGNKIALFRLDVAPDACLNTSAYFHLIAGSGLYRATMTKPEKIGIITEDWESDGFTTFPWTSGGVAPWFIDTVHYQGKYSARSGVIGNNSTSWLRVVNTSGPNDSISFYRKVSSEDGYDWLHFFIDSVPVGKWSGEQDWQRVAFPVSAGTHVYKWWYVTDISNLVGSNAGWVDNIVFPAPPLPIVFAGNDTTICAGRIMQLRGSVSYYDSLKWSSSGDGTFSNDTIPNPTYTPGANDISSGHVILLMKATGSSGCNENSLSLSINPSPVAQITVFPKDTVCAGKLIHLYADSLSGWDYLWTPGGIVTPEIAIDTSMTGGIGSRWFRLQVTNGSDCSSFDSVRISFKDCSGINEIANMDKFDVFPNPNNGTFTVKIRLQDHEKVSIRLQNSLSILVFEDKDINISWNFARTYTLNTLPPGIYILTLQSEQGSNNIKMIVK
jgi:hypothetical protein